MEREKEEERRQLNKLLNQENATNAEFKRRMKQVEKENDKINKLIEEEELKNKEENDRFMQEIKKENEKKLISNWNKYNDRIKKKRAEEEEKNSKKWNQISEEISINCQHGNDIYKCAICRRYFPKNSMFKLKKKNYKNGKY